MNWDGDSDIEPALAAKMELRIAEHRLREAEEYVKDCQAKVEKWENELAGLKRSYKKPPKLEKRK